MNNAISTEKRPWFMVVLARMDLRARCSCAAEGLRCLGDGLRSTQLTPEDRFVICASLMTMVRESGDNYTKESIVYLEQLSRQLEPPRPWYMVMLDQISIHASSEGYMQELIEAGDDLKGSETTEAERGSIVARLDNMLVINASSFKPQAFAYLRSLRLQLVEDV